MIQPIVLGGICNMVFVKSKFLNNLKQPIDRGYLCNDGQRLFGDNKTWKGFIGMIGLTAMWMWLFEYLAKSFQWANDLSAINYQSFRFPYNGLLYGAIWGLAYVLAELPNSYVKRRIGISAGQNATGIIGSLFTVVDQADSVIGCVLVVPIFYSISLIDSIVTIALGSVLHLLINMMLFVVGLKQQAR
jgi:CDP-diglyceride synthetase